MNAAKIRDELLNADARQVARAVMAVADSLQSFPASVQLGAMAYGFSAWIRLTKQDYQDTFTAVNNISVDSAGKRPEFKGVDEYLKNEVIKCGR